MSQIEKTPRKPRVKKTSVAQSNEMPEKNNHPGVRTISSLDAPFDWKSLIPNRYIDVASGYLDKKGIQNYESLSTEEKEKIKIEAGEENLLIKLAGFKYLAHLRGVCDVSYELKYSGENQVSAQCFLSFEPVVLNDNYFPSMKVTGLASATEENTTYPFSLFLESMAENRSFIRAAKMAFNINVLGSEEINGNTKTITSELMDSDAPKTVHDTLEKLVTDKGKTFADLKVQLQKKNWDGYESWSTFKDIPSNDACLIITTIVNKTLKKDEN